MEDETPIFNFQGLRDLLIRKGYQIGKAEPWRTIDSEDVSLSEGNIEFSDDGIFVIDDDGSRRQVFLYKRKYHLQRYGKPRYHICKCNVIDRFLMGTDIPEYRKANTKSVKVLDMDNDLKETEVSDLPLCRYCAAIIYNNNNYDMNSSEFSEILRNASEVDDNENNNEVDINGYTKDWHEISAKFREKHNYTCENCGVQVSPFESEFMHVHHKNGRKTDNRESNLQCLCIKCHSEVNPEHVRNFSTRGQQLLIKLFLDSYGDFRNKR